MAGKLRTLWQACGGEIAQLNIPAVFLHLPLTGGIFYTVPRQVHVQKSLRLFSFTLLAFFRFSVFSCSPCFFPFFFFSLFSSFPFCSFPLFPLFRFFPCSSFFPLFCFPFPSFRSFFSALSTFPALLFAYIRLFYRCSKNGRKMPDKGQRHFL